MLTVAGFEPRDVVALATAVSALYCWNQLRKRSIMRFCSKTLLLLDGCLILIGYLYKMSNIRRR
jgi:hypothetical protein